MKNLRSIILSAAFLFPVTNAQATTVEQDFQRCTSAALKDRQQNLPVINIDNQGMKHRQLDHDSSAQTSQYRMRVVNSVSGQSVGNIICILDRSGNLLSAMFE